MASQLSSINSQSACHLPGCSAVGSMIICGKCKVVTYCTESHQNLDLVRHNIECINSASLPAQKTWEQIRNSIVDLGVREQDGITINFYVQNQDEMTSKVESQIAAFFPLVQKIRNDMGRFSIGNEVHCFFTSNKEDNFACCVGKTQEEAEQVYKDAFMISVIGEKYMQLFQGVNS